MAIRALIRVVWSMERRGLAATSTRILTFSSQLEQRILSELDHLKIEQAFQALAVALGRHSAAAVAAAAAAAAAPLQTAMADPALRITLTNVLGHAGISVAPGTGGTTLLSSAASPSEIQRMAGDSCI